MRERRETWTTTGGDKVTVYEGSEGEARWNVRARNGEIVGSGEAHTHWYDAVRAAERHHPRIADEP